MNPYTPVAQKVADEVVFRHFLVEAVDFFKSDLTDCVKDFFLAASKINLYYQRIMFLIEKG